MSDSYRRWQAPSLDISRRGASNDNTPVSQKEMEALEEQARAKGFEIGKWEGLEAGKADAEARARQLTALLDSVAKPLQKFERQLAEELAGLAVKLGGLLAGKALAVDPEALLNVIEEALAELPPDQQQLNVLMHPEDVALISDYVGVNQAGKGTAGGENRPWRLLEDPAIARGGCQISTPDSFIDATLTQRCETLLNALLEARANGG